MSVQADDARDDKIIPNVDLKQLKSKDLDALATVFRRWTKTQARIFTFLLLGKISLTLMMGEVKLLNYLPSWDNHLIHLIMQETEGLGKSSRSSWERRQRLLLKDRFDVRVSSSTHNYA